MPFKLAQNVKTRAFFFIKEQNFKHEHFLKISNKFGIPEKYEQNWNSEKTNL